MENKILNPKTGRYVNKTGKIGRMLLSSPEALFSKMDIQSSSENVVFEINGPVDNTNQNIACFDFDQTLVKPKGDRPFPKDKNDWKFVRSNVPENIKKLFFNGYSIYIFTNQTKEWKIDMIKNSLSSIGIPIKVIVGFKKGITKPDKRLFFDNVFVKFSKKSFYTGDAYDSSIHFSDSDLKFAQNIGITFKIPEEIFPIELVKKDDNKNYENTKQEIVILIGFPASGKSTFAKNKLKSYKIISGDELKTLPKMISSAKKFLDLGSSVVFDATNPKPENRAKIIELGKKYKIPVRCFVFKTDMETSMEFNTKRFNETGKKVPKIAFYMFRKNYVKPNSNDGCSVVDI